MEKKGKRFYYYKQCTINLIQHEVVLCVFFFLDYLTIYSNFVLTIAKIIDADYKDAASPVFYLSPFNIYKHYIGANQAIALGIIVVSMVLLAVYAVFFFSLNEENVEPTNPVRIKLYQIVSNVYELFLIRILAIFIYDSIITLLIQTINAAAQETSISTNVLLIIITLLYLIAYLSWNVYSIRSFCVWSNFHFFKGIVTYFPFDMVYSSKFDLALLIGKVLICLNKNLALHPALPYSKSAEFFFATIFELIIFISFLHLLYDLFIQRTNFLFYQFHPSNKLRIFLTLFSGSSIIIKVLLYQNYFFVFYPVLVLVLIGEILLFAFKFNDHIMSRLIRSDDCLGVIIFVIANDVDIPKCICQWSINHRLTCANSLCSICLKLSLANDSRIAAEKATKSFKNYTKITIIEFIHLLWEEVVLQLRTRKNLSAAYVYCVECIELVEFFLSGKDKQIIFYMAFYKALKKYEDTNLVLHNNLLIMFDFIKKLNTDFLRSYAEFQQSEALIHLIKKYLDDFESFLLYTTKTPENVIKIAEKYDKLIKNRQELRFFPASIQEYNFQQIIVRHIYELIIKATLPGAHEFDVTMLYDFLDSHFRSDQIVIIKYSFKVNSSYIIKAGGVIKKNINKPFESLFPNKVKMVGLSLFLELLHQNDFKSDKNIFEFVVKHLSDQQGLFIEAFWMKYVLYPSIETDEMIIVGSFNVGYTNVVIFERSGGKEPVLYSFSKKMEKYFGFPPSAIQNLKGNGKTFAFSQVFKKKNARDSNDCTFTFQFILFISLLNDYIDDSVEVHQSFYDKINQIRQLGSNNPDKAFVLESKFTLSEDNTTYVVYFVQNEQVVEKESKDEHSTSLRGAAFQPQTVNFQNTCFDNVSMSCSSSVTSNTSFLNAKIEMKKVSAIEKSGFKSINLFVRIISGFSLLLVALCLIFLVLEIQYDRNFQTLFFLFQNFKSFKRGLELQPLRLFSNLCMEVSEGDHESGCLNNYFMYSLRLGMNSPEMAGLPLVNEVVYDEFKVILESLKQLFVQFQSEMFDLNINELNVIYDYQCLLISLVADDTDDNTKVLSKNYSFFDGVNLYYNFISQVINSDLLRLLPIRFLDFDSKTMQLAYGNLVMSHIDQVQKNVYHVILNYPFIHKALLFCESSIEFGFEKYLASIEKVLIVFTVLLMVLHCVLLFICLQFITNYKKVIDEDYCKVISIISSPSYLAYINAEIASIKTLLELYDEKPSVVASKLFYNRDHYKKTKKEEQSKQLQSSYAHAASGSNPQRAKSSNNKAYDSIVALFRLIILLCFVAYCAFFVVIFTVMFLALSELKYLVEYTYINSKIDNYVFDNLNANQYIILSNVTSFELSGFILGNSSIHYIREGINQHFIYLEQLEIFIRKHKSFQLISDREELSCDNMKAFKDQNIQLIEQSQATPYDDLTPFLAGLCRISPIMSYRNEVVVQKEVCYTMRKLGYYSNKASFAEKAEYITDSDIYGLYNLVLVLNRLLRAYVNNELLPERVNSISTQFRVAVIVCLVINCIVEVSIVAILLFFVMKRMIELNKIFTQFMKFLD